MKIRVQRIGGIWHGTIDGHPDVDVRGLTEEIARRKVEAVALTLSERVRSMEPRKSDDKSGAVE
ncbi:MAG TPA: hypothetical protein VGJ81_12485 [Thermoanaerobaculia bacterium]|jgi:hypothetical protein